MDTAVQIIVESLSDSDAKLRKEAAVKLLYLGAKAKSAVPALLARLDDPDRDVRLWSAYAIARHDQAKAKACVPHLVEALKADGELWHQENAAAAFHRIGAPPDALPALINCLELPYDPAENKDGMEAESRLKIMTALVVGGLRAKAAPAVPALVKLLDGPDQPIRNENTGEVAEAVVEALGKIGKKARAALPSLKKKLEGASKALRSKIAGAIAEIE